MAFGMSIVTSFSRRKQSFRMILFCMNHGEHRVIICRMLMKKENCNSFMKKKSWIRLL
uniref:Uncharacterized protein n=1 Tax=Oryza barthii TaxID=65489 RepID=A0A0D3GCM2_9ORYZ